MAQTSGPSASKVRRQRERIEMRARLLDAARTIAIAEGWQAVTIRRIAERLEYTAPILYQHFAGKDALLQELVREGFRELSRRLREAATQPPDRLLPAVAEAYWDFAFDAPELYQVMHGLDGVPFGTAETPQEAREAFTLCRDAVLRAAAAQGHTLDEPDDVTDAFWAWLHGFVSLAMSSRIAGPRQRARDIMLRAADMFARHPLVRHVGDS